jgi:hypothetical protein
MCSKFTKDSNRIHEEILGRNPLWKGKSRQDVVIGYTFFEDLIGDFEVGRRSGGERGDDDSFS